MSRAISIILALAMLCLSCTGICFAGGTEAVICEDGALCSDGWSMKNAELTSKGLSLETNGADDPAYIYKNEYLPLTADSRADLAVSFRIRSARMGGYAPYYNLFLVQDYGDGRLMYIQPKTGWKRFVKDSGTDWCDVCMPLSEFCEKGRVRSYSDSEWDPESNTDEDKGFRLETVDWSKILVGVGLMGVDADYSYENYGYYFDWGTVVADNIRFISYAEPSAELYATDANNKRTRLENGASVPANAIFTAEFNSDFVEDEETVKASVTLAEKNGAAVALTAEKNKRVLRLTPDEPLKENEKYVFTVKGGLTDELGGILPEKSVEIVTSKNMVYLKKPEPVSAVPESCDTVRISWRETDGAERYYLYRDGEKIAETEGLLYSDTTLMPQTEYSYSICAISGATVSEQSDSTAVTTQEFEQPENPVVLYTGCGEIRIGWEGGAAAYSVSLDGGAEERISGREFVISNLNAGTHKFSVRAIGANSLNNEYLSAATEITAELPAGAAGEYISFVRYGRLGAGITTGGWSTSDVPSYSSAAETAGMDAGTNAYEFYMNTTGGVNLTGNRNISFDSYRDDGGFFFYVRAANQKDTGRCGLHIKTGKEPGVLFPINFDEWTPIYIPFSAYAENVFAPTFKGIHFVGRAQTGHKFYVEDFCITRMKPEVDSVYLSEDGRQSDGNSEGARTVNIRFTAPIDAETLENIRLYSDNRLVDGYETVYSAAGQTAMLTVPRDWKNGSEIKVVIPETVKGTAYYTVSSAIQDGAVPEVTTENMAEGESCVPTEVTLKIRDKQLTVTANADTDGDMVRGMAEVSNSSDSDRELVVFCVVYGNSEGVLRYKGYKMKKLTVKAHESLTVYTDGMSFAAGDSFDVFAWDSLTNMFPIE